MKFRYLIVSYECTVTGTNDERVARAAVPHEMVVDVQEGKELLSTQIGGLSESQAEDIPEETTYQPA